MAKFCTKCGAQCDDSTVFCTKCGAKFDNAAPSQAAPASDGGEKTILEKFKENANMESIKELQKNPNFNKILGIAVIAVAAIIIIAIIISIATSGYKKPIDNFFKGIQKTDAEAFISTVPEYITESMEDNIKDGYYGEDVDSIEEYYENYLEEMLDVLEDDFGKDVKFSYKVVDKEELKNRDINDIEDSAEEIYDEKIDVSKGYEVDVEYTIKGKDDKEEDLDATFIIIKVDGNWAIQNFELDDY